MTFKWRMAARGHMKREHNMDKFFCIIAGCGVSQRTAAGIKHHYREAHNHDAGEQRAPGEPEDLEGPEEHHNRVHQGTQSRATCGHGQTPPREGHTGDRGTKRPKKGCEAPPNTEWVKTNKDGRGHNGTAGKQGVKRQDPRGQRTSDQHLGHEDFWKKFHDALDDLKAKRRVVSGNEEPTEGTQEDPQSPGPKGL